MNFREASDSLCSGLDHGDLAKALGVSLQTVRQARMEQQAKSHRSPPKDWQEIVIRLAEKEIMRNRQLIERIRKEIEVKK